MKRLIALIVAVAALAGAVGAMKTLDTGRKAQNRADAERAAGEARSRLADGLRVATQTLEIRASTAAALPQLGALVRTLPDPAAVKTLENAFREEPYWAPFRAEFTVEAIALGGDALDVVFGAPAGALQAAALVRQARADGLSSGIVVAEGRPLVAAAARVQPSGAGRPAAVLVLAKPFDDKLLTSLAERAGGALLLSDGQTERLAAGSPEELARLRTAVGREAPGTPVVEDEGLWAAGVTPLGPGLWLWAHGSAPEAVRQTTRSVNVGKALVGGGAVLVALLALVFGLRRPRTDDPSARPSGANEPSARPTGANDAPPSRTASGAGGAPRSPTAPSAGPAVDVLGATLAGAGSPAAPGDGRQFGRYTLIDRLGEGGMAQVYTAVIFGAEGFRRRFVVKRLRPELATEPTVVSQFIDEAKLASTLVHSNIIPVFDFGKVGDEYFLATEYILGRDLGRLTARMCELHGRGLPVEVVLFCAHEILEALAYAHTRTGDDGRPLGLVHRDVSPSNVLVSARGEVKLFDFGIVKAEGRVTRTQHGVVKGNVSFMSPEQARGADVDARADLFSLGLVMYYALTGEVLYRGDTTYELLVKAATGPGPEELARIAALPGPAAALVARALAVAPEARFPSAAAFAAAVAPHANRAAADLPRVMETLFGEDFVDEERRFAALAPDALPSGATPTGTRRTS